MDYEWISSLKPFEGATVGKSVKQLTLTLSMYIVLIGLMVFIVASGYPYWIALLLSVPAAGFHVKTFIIMHDCGHNSYFRSQKVSAIVGRICAFLTFTPYYDWRRSHAIHHASVSNLEKRGIGDVWTMTVDEYRQSTFATRLKYRVYRNPFFLFILAPILLFLVVFRFPLRSTKKKCLWSVLLTDLALALLITAISLTLGFMVFLKVFLPVVVIASISGVWLFYIQHQFKNVYWAHTTKWDSVKAAMEGSSYYKLPALLRWFSGNIGYHHIHHLNSRIPNYNLKICYQEIPQVRDLTPITIRASLSSLFLSLWDEKSGKMVDFRSQEAAHQ